MDEPGEPCPRRHARLVHGHHADNCPAERPMSALSAFVQITPPTSGGPIATRSPPRRHQNPRTTPTTVAARSTGQGPHATRSPPRRQQNRCATPTTVAAESTGQGPHATRSPPCRQQNRCAAPSTVAAGSTGQGRHATRSPPCRQQNRCATPTTVAAESTGTGPDATKSPPRRQQNRCATLSTVAAGATDLGLNGTGEQSQSSRLQRPVAGAGKAGQAAPQPALMGHTGRVKPVPVCNNWSDPPPADALWREFNRVFSVIAMTEVRDGEAASDWADKTPRAAILAAESDGTGQARGVAAAARPATTPAQVQEPSAPVIVVTQRRVAPAGRHEPPVRPRADNGIAMDATVRRILERPDQPADIGTDPPRLCAIMAKAGGTDAATVGIAAHVKPQGPGSAAASSSDRGCGRCRHRDTGQRTRWRSGCPTPPS